MNTATAVRYLSVSAFCLIVGIVYEFFGKDVYSAYMLLFFMIPLVSGALPFFILSKTKMSALPSLHSRYLYHSGVATLTVGCAVKGALVIYGTSNKLLIYYLFIGCLFIGAGITAFVVDIIIRSAKAK
jgi:hypothetical protein